MSQFKVGDRVGVSEGTTYRKRGEVGVVKAVDDCNDTYLVSFGTGDEDGDTENWLDEDKLKKTSKTVSAMTFKYVLEFYNDGSQCEFFESEKEMLARVSALLGESGVQHSSYRWYEIARHGTVELQPKLKLSLAENKPAKRRGRPRKVATS